MSAISKITVALLVVAGGQCPMLLLAALFVTSGFGADRPEGLALARAWGLAGHAIGKHQVTHPSLHSAKVDGAQPGPGPL
jgi:hypothetical protein